MNDAVRTTRGKVVLACLVLFLGTAALFSRAVLGGFLDYDDPDYVTKNVHVQEGLRWSSVKWAFGSFEAANWHPLTWLSHELDWELYGPNPAGHHATSVVLHAIAAVLAFLALRKISGAFWPSFSCAAAFAWHPLRVESVAWIAERKDVLSACGALLTLWAYGTFVQCRKEGDARAVRWYCLTLVAFALGLLCKPMLVTLPCLMLVLDFWPLERMEGDSFRKWSGLILEKLPLFALALVSCLLTYFAQRGSNAVVEALPLDLRLANAAISIVRYMGKFFWPFALATGYPLPAHWPLVDVIAAVAVVSTISTVAWRLRSRSPWILAGWLWFVGMLMPVLGIVQVGLQSMADRYSYLPILGLEIALFWSLYEIQLPAFARRAAVAGSALAMIGCALRTWNQIGTWHDPESLYRHALTATQDDYLGECYLGTTLLNERKLDEAALHLRSALEIRGDYSVAALRLGLILEHEHRTKEAIACYESLLSRKPNQEEIQRRLGALLLGNHDAVAACDHLRTALELRPLDDEALDDLGAAMESVGRPDVAERCYKRETAVRPDLAQGHYNLGVLLLNRQDWEGAVNSFSAAVRMQPNNASALNALNIAMAQLDSRRSAASDSASSQ